MEWYHVVILIVVAAGVLVGVQAFRKRSKK
jgi:hypothetical protein